MLFGSCLIKLSVLAESLGNDDMHDVLYERVQEQITLRHVKGLNRLILGKDESERFGIKIKPIDGGKVSICSKNIRGITGTTYERLLRISYVHEYTPKLPRDEQRDECLNKIKEYYRNRLNDIKGQLSVSRIFEEILCSDKQLAELAASKLIKYQGKEECWNYVDVQPPDNVERPSEAPIVIADRKLQVFRNANTINYQLTLSFMGVKRKTLFRIAKVGSLIFPYYKESWWSGYIVNTNPQTDAESSVSLSDKGRVKNALLLTDYSLELTNTYHGINLGCPSEGRTL